MRLLSDLYFCVNELIAPIPKGRFSDVEFEGMQRAAQAWHQS